MYSRGAMRISHYKNMTQPIHCLKFWKGGELEVFWSGIKQYRWDDKETERK